MFAATNINIKERVKANTQAFSIISEMMGEAYELDQYKRLTTYLDPKLARNISSGKVNWKTLDYKDVCKSHELIVGNPIIKRPLFKIDGNAELVVNTTGPKSEMTSKNFVLICDPELSVSTLKACFQKDLKDYAHGKDARVAGCNLIFAVDSKILKDKIGDKKTIMKLPFFIFRQRMYFRVLSITLKLIKKVIL